MKNKSGLICLLLLVAGIISCKKELQKTLGTSALNIINATTNQGEFDVNFTFSPVNYSANGAKISYQGSQEFGNPSGNLPVELTASIDTVAPLYKNTLNLKAGGIYSLYIGGPGTSSQLLMEDNIPAIKDSSAGVRFVNFSPGSSQLSINIQGNPASQTLVSDLVYKQVSQFIKLPTPGSVSNYTFEIRDAITGDLLTTYTWNYRVFYCNTIVIDGSTNSSANNPFGAFQVNNY